MHRVSPGVTPFPPAQVNSSGIAKPRHGFQDRRHQVSLTLIQLGAPDIEQEDDARRFTIIPRLMVDAIVKGPGLTPTGLSAIIANPQPAPGRDDKREVANQAAVEQAGMGVDTGTAIQLGKQYRGSETSNSGKRQPFHDLSCVRAALKYRGVRVTISPQKRRRLIFTVQQTSFTLLGLVEATVNIRGKAIGTRRQ